MIMYRVTGYCSECSSFQKIEGITNAEDAEMLFHQEHMVSKGHWFEGSVEMSSYEDKAEVGKKFKGVKR